MGVLAGARLLFHLNKFTGTQFSPSIEFVITCDSQKVINTLNRRRQYDRVYANATLATDWDILEEIHQTYESFPIGAYQYLWARGRIQDTDADTLSTTMTAYIQVADNLAYEYRAHTRTSAKTATFHLVPSAKCALILTNHPTTTAYRENIRTAASHTDVMQYLQTRHGWDEQTRATVDW
jgi:hypothetical protein